jgi:phage anti-repressor protein
MSYSAKECLDKARECTLMASEAKNRDIRAALIQVAQQWEELARQKEDLEWDRAKLP